jgi:hypothetical protein
MAAQNPAAPAARKKKRDLSAAARQSLELACCVSLSAQAVPESRCANAIAVPASKQQHKAQQDMAAAAATVTQRKPGTVNG